MDRNDAKDVIEAELIAIKRLLVLLLLKAGATQDEVGMALGYSQSKVSRMFGGEKVKKFQEAE
jgi:predicted transcriptional regulator